jgi:hypothetical protein
VSFEAAVLYRELFCYILVSFIDGFVMYRCPFKAGLTNFIDKIYVYMFVEIDIQEIEMCVTPCPGERELTPNIITLHSLSRVVLPATLDSISVNAHFTRFL